MLAAPAVLIDQARLTELVAFCGGKVIESGLIYAGTYADAITFVMLSGSSCVLAECVDKYPFVMHGIYAPLLKWFFQSTLK